jgi:WD40 repeat protein
MFVWRAHEGAVTSLAFVPGGGLLSTGCDGNVRLWDTAGGALQHGWKLAEAKPPSESDLFRVLCDSSGRYAAVALRSEGLQFFDLDDGSSAGEFVLTSVLGCAPAPDGASVFIVGRERVQWRTRQDARVYQHAYPPGAVLASSQGGTSSGALAIRPDGT